MFSFHGVTKKFKTDFWKPPSKALDNLSFRVEKHSITGLIGANGSGKTTAIKTALGLIFPDSGNIDFYGWKKTDSSKIIQEVGYMPERPYYYSYLTGLEFLIYMGELNNVDKKALFLRIEDYSDRLSIKEHLSKKISGYSKGMLQRLGLTASLLHGPQLLILDEPTAGIDPLGRKEIKDFLLLLKDEGKSIFISSHIFSDLEEICSHLVIIDKGKLIYQGKTDELIEENTKERYYAVLEKKGPLPDSISKDVKKISGEKYEYTLDKRDRKDFLKVCIESDIIPLKFEKKTPSLEEVVYRFP